jgi:hypothetical protein
MKMLGESMKVKEPVSLVERRAFMKLPLVDRRKIMARQAKEIAVYYEKDVSWKDLETGASLTIRRGDVRPVNFGLSMIFRMIILAICSSR